MLLDFTVQYLVEQPDDLASFALVYFSRLQARKPINHAGNHHSDDSVMSDEDEIGQLKKKLPFRLTKFHPLLLKLHGY